MSRNLGLNSVIVLVLLINGCTLATWADYYQRPPGVIQIVDSLANDVSLFIDRIPSVWYWLLVLVAALAVAVIGRWRGWATSRGLHRAMAALGLGMVIGAVTISVMQVRHTSDLAIYGKLRHLSSTLDQHFLETGRILATLDDIVGPTKLMRELVVGKGEDYTVNFPIRRNQAVAARLPDGRLLIYDRYNPNMALRIPRPVPPDGVSTEVFEPTGGRIEITYRNGVPDGPYRAYTADGRLLGEVTYAQGRITTSVQ